MTAYTAGDLKQAFYVAESSYGVIPTGALSWVGETIMLRNLMDKKVEFLTLPGSSTFGANHKGPYDAGFVAQFYDRAGSDWTEFFATYGYGSAGGFSDAAALGDFTFQSRVGTKYKIWNGCMINRADIIADAPGKNLKFEIEALAQWFRGDSTAKALTGGMQNVTVGADPADETGAVLFWDGNSQINLGGGGLTTWYPESWKLSLVNNLERQYGIRTGDDGTKYPVTVKMHRGAVDIVLEATLIVEDDTYEAAKAAGTAVTALTLPVDNETITLANGVFEANDLPEYAQAINRENIRIRFPSLAIA